MQTVNMPQEFPGTAEERAANQATHSFWNVFGDDGDARCMDCDCRPGSVTSGWPCGSSPNRVTTTIFGEGDEPIVAERLRVLLHDLTRT